MKCFDCFAALKFEDASDVLVAFMLLLLLFYLLLSLAMQTHLKLKSGEAQRTATLGICGTRRMAQAT